MKGETIMDFTGYTVDELVGMKAKIADEIKAKREAAKATAKVDAEAREAYARKNVSENDTIAFLFNKTRTEGKALRVSEKTVTVEFDLNGETVTRYRKYSDILEVTGSEADEADESDTEEVAE
jgi:hypothetical protein